MKLKNKKIFTDKKNHWDKFYKKFNLKSESSFARFVIKWLKNKKYNFNKNKIIDIGCGNSRDGNFFNINNLKVTGVDMSQTAIQLNKAVYPDINFYKKNICSLGFELKNDIFNLIYARFFLHAITEPDENRFLKNCKKISNKKSIFFLEFRTTKDSLMKKGLKLKDNARFHGHYRRFIDVNFFLKKLNICKFKILYFSEGIRYAKFNKERPHVCRLILKNI